MPKNPPNVFDTRELAEAYIAKLKEEEPEAEPREVSPFMESNSGRIKYSVIQKPMIIKRS